MASRLALAAVFALTCRSAQATDYIARLDFGPVKLRLALHLNERTGGPLTATADSIDQDAFDLPVTGLRRQGQALAFQIPRIGGRFQGAFTKDGSVLEGTWRQRGGPLPVRFEPGNLRPQEPAPPYPYHEEHVVCGNGRIRLAGTLTLPASGGPHPAVVLITGSGPQDRNDTTSGHRPFLVWADYLTRRGFAVLRMDDRGVGGSTGKLLDSTDQDLAGDTLAAVALLEHRPDIDARRIGLLGHSEGGLVAPLAAAVSHAVAFVVMLAGPAIPGDRILVAQSERVARAMGVPDEIARTNRDVLEKLLVAARTTSDPAVARRRMQSVVAVETSHLLPEQAAAVRGQIGGQIALAASPWFRFILSYDPKPTLEKLECPVLALYGSLDVQVPADLNAALMEEALARNRRHQVLTIPGLNHMFQTADTGSPAEYAQIEETVAPQVLEIVSHWLGEVVGRPILAAAGLPAGWTRWKAGPRPRLAAPLR